MTNAERISNIGIGAVAGCLFGLAALIPIFILFRIDPAFWFVATIFSACPIGAFLGWRYATRIAAWMQKTS